MFEKGEEQSTVLGTKPCMGSSDSVPSVFHRSSVLSGENDLPAKASPQESVLHESASRYGVETQKQVRRSSSIFTADLLHVLPWELDQAACHPNSSSNTAGIFSAKNIHSPSKLLNSFHHTLDNFSLFCILIWNLKTWEKTEWFLSRVERLSAALCCVCSLEKEDLL